jgi:hypothetical protein
MSKSCLKLVEVVIFDSLFNTSNPVGLLGVPTQNALQTQIVALQAQIVALSATNDQHFAAIEKKLSQIYNASAWHSNDRLQEVPNAANALPSQQIPVLWYPQFLEDFSPGVFTHARADALYHFYGITPLGNTDADLGAKFRTIKREIGVRI